jgi:hypothetical protein
MKTKKLFYLKTLFFTVAIPLFSLAAKKPARDGTQIALNAEDIADLKQWIETAKHELSILEDNLRRGTLEERRAKIAREFENIVSRSGKKENELLMRYTLNRALEVDELVGASPEPSELQSLVGFLDSTIQLAKGYYTDDQKYLEAIGRSESPQLQTSMVTFGYQYSQLIFAFSRTFLRPALEYKMTYAALGWLANDLNSSRNLKRVVYSEEILRVSYIQKEFPEEPAGDDQKILNEIRKLKWETRERVLASITRKDEDMRAAAEAVVRAAEEKRRIAHLEKSEQERLLALSVAERNEEILRAEQAKLGIIIPRAQDFAIGYAAIYGSAFGNIEAKKPNGRIAFRFLYGGHITNDVPLESIAIAAANFCSKNNTNYCVNTDGIYGTTVGKVAGIMLNGNVAFQYKYNDSITSSVSVQNIAIMSGCSSTHPKYCVGSKAVYGSSAGSIIGLLPNGRVAFQNSYGGAITNNIDPDNLALK